MGVFFQADLRRFFHQVSSHMIAKITVRFAPHLEKCMGMGRTSSRLASRRIAASNAASTRGDDADVDDLDDDDWIHGYAMRFSCHFLD